MARLDRVTNGTPAQRVARLAWGRLGLDGLWATRKLVAALAWLRGGTGEIQSLDPSKHRAAADA
jgi:hypothetical protein